MKDSSSLKQLNFLSHHTHTHNPITLPLLRAHGVIYIVLFLYRAKIERDYGESLIKLSRTTSGKDEIG